MSHRTALADIVPERGLCKLTGVLRDENGTPLGAVTTLTLTLWHVASGGLVDSVGRPANQNILNINGGSLDGSGNFALRLTGADNQIVDTAAQFEAHEALIRFTYGGDGVGWHRVQFYVENASFIP